MLLLLQMNFICFPIFVFVIYFFVKSYDNLYHVICTAYSSTSTTAIHHPFLMRPPPMIESRGPWNSAILEWAVEEGCLKQWESSDFHTFFGFSKKNHLVMPEWASDMKWAAILGHSANTDASVTPYVYDAPGTHSVINPMIRYNGNAVCHY